MIVEEANKTFGTDSVAEDVEYGFAGEIGADAADGSPHRRERNLAAELRAGERAKACLANKAGQLCALRRGARGAPFLFTGTMPAQQGGTRF